MAASPTVSACPGPSGCATRSRSPTTCPATRSVRSGSSRSRREMERHDWFGCERRARAGGDARAAARRAPGARTSTTSRSCPRRGGGPIDMDTVAVRGDLRGGAARGGRRGRAGGCAARRAAATRVLGACARPGTTPSRRGRWASASSTTSRSPARHARAAHGVERVLILDWDVHHGNGTNAIFHADPSVLFVSIHEWPLYPGTGPASRPRARARARATRSTCRSPAGSGDATLPLAGRARRARR